MQIENELKKIFDSNASYQREKKNTARQLIKLNYMSFEDLKRALPKILALEKPEPLAKNKQPQEFFCYNKERGFNHSLCSKSQCSTCERMEKKRADATSR